MIRNFGRISTRFWAGEIAKQLRSGGRLVQVIAAYLKSAPSSTALGLYYLPLPTLCHEVGCSLAEAQKALQTLSDIGLAHYDVETEHVWIPTMAGEEIAPTLQPKDKRIPWLKQELDKLRTVPFFNSFLDQYREAFNLQDMSPQEGASKGYERGSGDPSMPSSFPSSSSFTETDAFTKTETEGSAEEKEPPPAVLNLFNQIWTVYPTRGGKKLGRQLALEKFGKLSEPDQHLILIAVENYARSPDALTGIGIKDCHRWIRDGKAREPWREWLEPAATGKENHNGRIANKDFAVGAF